MAFCTQKTNSDGNPNVFNVERNDDGNRWLNTNWTNPDDQWNLDNRIVFRLRNSLHFSFATRVAGEFCFVCCARACSIVRVIWPFQPPSILPISSMGSEMAAYFLLSSDFVSQQIIRRIFTVSIFRIAIRTYGCFSVGPRKLAAETASIVSIKRVSILSPREWR